MANFNLAELFMDTVHADIIFVVDDKEIPGHRVILAKTCPHFDKLLFHDTLVSKLKKVVIRGTPAKVFKELIRFIYKGQLEVKEWTMEDFLSLLALAHEYKFQPLFTAVVKALEAQQLDFDSWELVKSAAAMYDSDELRRKCASFAEDKIDDFILQKNLEKFSSEFIFCMSIRPKMFTCNQDNVLKAICKWKHGRSSTEITSALQSIGWNKVSPDITATVVKELFSMVKNVQECKFWSMVSEDLEGPSNSNVVKEEKVVNASTCILRKNKVLLSKANEKTFSLPNNKGILECCLYVNYLQFAFKKDESDVYIPVKGMEFDSSTKFNVEDICGYSLNGDSPDMIVSEPTLNNGWFKYRAVFSDVQPVYCMVIISDHFTNIGKMRLRDLVIY